MAEGLSEGCLVITGASKGIGLAIAQKFQTQGYGIVNISRTPAPVDGCIQITADMRDPNCWQTAGDPLRRAVLGKGPVVVVHNAALNVPAPVQALDAEVLRRMLEVNVVAPQAINRLLLATMPSGSSIIYMGSTMSLKSSAGMAAYTTCKHALVGLMRSTCQDLAGTGIHTACICPGFTDTEMLRAFAGDNIEQVKSMCTQGRLIEPSEIAETVYFCATSPVLNGGVIRADLGLVEY